MEIGIAMGICGWIPFIIWIIKQTIPWKITPKEEIRTPLEERAARIYQETKELNNEYS